MIQDQFSFKEFNFSSQAIQDLVSSKETVQSFVSDFFTLDNLSIRAKNKKFTKEQRTVLVDQLIVQNRNIELSSASKNNAEALRKENTVTITTGHQLNLMTGPLYSIYKVAQVISLCHEMNSRNDGQYYVPVFWMATEDHDFEEINHIHLFGNKIGWDKQGQDSRIVGEVVPEGISDFTGQIEEKYANEELKKQIASFTDVYKASPNLAEATRQIINRLFSAYGLVIIDGNDAELKKAFAPVAEKEVLEGFVHQAVSGMNNALNEAGYHNQVFVRECNLFKIQPDGKRIRIAKEGETFLIEEKAFTAEELITEITKNPKAFSPNALLRPVYQELILPNIAYIGGGGEIAYWLQLKAVFNAINLEFPLLRVRDSILLLKEKEVEALEALPFSLPELKRDLQDLVKEIALQDVKVEIKLNAEIEALQAIKQKVLNKAIAVNKGLTGMIEAEFSKMEKSIEKLEAKLIKAEKGKHDQKANKISKLQAKIYPNGGFQERYENFLPYFLSDQDFIKKIVDNLTAEDEPKIRVVQI